MSSSGVGNNVDTSGSQVHSRTKPQTSTNAPQSGNADFVAKRPIKKPTSGSRVNEEDEFSPARLAKAIALTSVVIVLIILFFYQVSVVVDKTYNRAYAGLLEFVLLGLGGLVLNLSISFKLVRFLNKVMFLKEDQDLEKKFI